MDDFKALRVGSLLHNGKYHIDKVIEQSGLSITYKATLLALDTQVLVRELYLPNKCTRNEDNSLVLQSLSEKHFDKYKRNFLEEGRTLAQFKHPNLLEVRDLIEENNTVYLIMDLLEGETLATYIGEKQYIGEQEALSITHQIALAVNEIHAKGYLHKCINPENIRLQNGKAILLGLGESGQFAVNAGSTPNYTPMEQYITQYTGKDKTGVFTDVYALAALLYFCVTGQHPISAVERQNIDLTPPQYINASVSSASNQAIMKAMAMQVEQRTPTIEAFIQQLPIQNLNNSHVQDALSKGSVIQQGKYRISSLIERDAFGITYKAVLVSLNLEVRIRELFLMGYCVRKQDHSLELQAMDMATFTQHKDAFAKDAKLLASFQHENIVKVRDIVEENNTIYLITENPSGKSLQNLVAEKGVLSEFEANNYLQQVADALNEIHTKGFVHKDVRPNNIIISKQAKAVLVGLGLDKERIQNNTETLSAGYAPMEQYASNTAISPTTDVYGLAASFYFALTAQPPTSAFDRYFSPINSPKSINPTISQQTNNALLKGLAMKAEERFASVGELARSLADPGKLKQPVGKDKRAWAVAASIVILLFVIGIFSVAKNPDEPIVIDSSEHQAYLKKADNLYQNGNFEVAASYYKAILNNQKSHKEAKAGLLKANAGKKLDTNWWNTLNDNWKTIFRQALEISGTPSKMQLKQLAFLDQLYCQRTPITSLAPIGNLVNLKKLYCDETKINSLAPVANLNQLEELACYNTNVSDLSPLKNLSRLRILDCSGTQISNIEVVKQLSNLEELYIANTQVSDISAVSNLSNLKELYCHSMPISSLAPIAKLSKLEKLQCYKTQIKSLQAISELTLLKELRCFKTPINDLTPISKLTNLRMLYCYNTQISELAPITNLKKLETLYVSNNPISDLSPVSNLVNLEKLYCYNTRINSIEPVEGLKRLEFLNFSSTQVNNIAPLKKLDNLKILHFSKTPVNTLSALSALNNIETLYCYATQINSLQPIANLSNLKALYFSDTQVTDIAPIAKLHNLNKLYFNNTQISDISALASLTNLSLLHMANTQVNDIEVLKNLSLLTELNLEGSSVGSIVSLKSLDKLEYLNLINTPIPESEVSEFTSQCKSCAVER